MASSVTHLKILRLAFALLCVAACHTETRAATSGLTHWSAAQLLGCYTILDEKRRQADSAWYNVMGIVRLTDVPMRKFDSTVLPRNWHLRPLSDAAKGRWKADPRGELEATPGFVPAWSLSPSGDSVSFDFGDGFSGGVLEFAAVDATGDTLRGRVTEHWDFGPPFTHDRGAAYAVRRACP